MLTMLFYEPSTGAALGKRVITIECLSLNLGQLIKQALYFTLTARGDCHQMEILFVIPFFLQKLMYYTQFRYDAV